MHARNHLDAPEHFAYQVMHGLRGIVAGSPDRLLTLADLQAIPEPLGAILVELPQREIGGQLPAWDDLVAIAEWARERGIPLHMDGARLWQCRPFYGRAYAEIAGLFDSVYVSFYKIIGGITGSALAGPAGLIEEARVWQWRHGGRLIHAFPLVLSAERGLDERLGRIDAYHVKAVEIASALGAFPDIEVVPDPPHTNMLHVYLRGDRERLMQAALEIAEQHDVFMIYRLGDSPLPRWQKFELTVGDATLDLTTDEIAALFHELFDRASRP
jgi:threonine aldolase